MATGWKNKCMQTISLAAALAMAAALAGCYTLLQHPRSSDPAMDSNALSGSCLRCHSDNSFDAGAVPWVEHYSYSSYPWINYYGSPWWHDTVWHWYDDDCRDCPPPETLPQLSGRSAWGRRPRDGWDGEGSRERTSSGLAPIASAPAPAPTPAPPAISGSASGSDASDESEAETPKEPRKRSIRR